MTEMSPSGTQSAIKPPLEELPREAQLETLCKQGYPLFGVEMKITDDKGKERPRDGKSVAECMELGKGIVTSDECMPGVRERITLLQVEATFPDGTKLVSCHDPIAP